MARLRERKRKRERERGGIQKNVLSARLNHDGECGGGGTYAPVCVQF